MIESIQIVFLFLGSIFIFIGALGTLLMPDTLSRAHALSKALTLGISLMLIGLLLERSTYAASTKIVLAILFQFVTIPLSGHIFAFFSYKKKLKNL